MDSTIDEQLTNPRGRPSKYKEEYCDMVIEHMAKGYSMESFGAICNVSKDTIYEWMKVHAEFSDAVSIGLNKSLLFFERLGIRGMAEGKINAGVYALTMANKHKWRQQHDVTTDGAKIESPVLFIPKEDDDK